MINTLEKIGQAAEGLFFMSESDFPLETVAFKPEKPDAPVTENLLQYLEQPVATNVEQQELSYFLRNQTRDLPEFGEEEKARAQKFRDLEALLKQEIPDVAVFRVGQRQVDAFIIGKLADGTLGGLKTKLIET